MSDQIVKYSEQRKVEVMPLSKTLDARQRVDFWIGHDAPAMGGKQFAARSIAAKISCTYGTLRNLLNGGRKSIDADLYDRVLDYDIARREEQMKRSEHAESFESRASRLEAVDPDFYGAEIDRYRSFAVRLRNLSAGKV